MQAAAMPDPLVLSDGRPVSNAADWPARRAEILELFSRHVYGRPPGAPSSFRCELTDSEENALDGLATRTQVTIRFTDADRPRMDLLYYAPNSRPGPVPAFLGLNFVGNHSVEDDPGIALPMSWMGAKAPGAVDHRATDAGRGARAGRWCVRKIVERGYAIATAYYGDLFPDHRNGLGESILPALVPAGELGLPDSPGAISAWAWGLSRALDHLSTDPRIDARRVAVMGHSRLGKAALWAGALDERFALVISNNSGMGGAAMSRGKAGETVANMTTTFPHWTCPDFAGYSGREDELPVDQHMLLALIAQRPLLVCSAEDDTWADPPSQFRSCALADPVYRLLGGEGLARKDMPGLNDLVDSRLGYHIRPGKHGVFPEDWDVYLRFADRHLA